MTNRCTAYSRSDGFSMNACSGVNCPFGKPGGKAALPTCPHLRALVEARRTEDAKA